MAKPATPHTPGGKAKKDVAKSSAKKAKSNKENMDPPVKKAHITVHWTKPENHHIMDTLLTLVEDSVVWKGAFGFDKGVEKDPTPTEKGRSIIEHCADIAKILFAPGEKDLHFTCDDLPHLRGVVKNRVMSSLKGPYTEYRNSLGETGHGLVVSGREDEFKSDIDLTVLGGKDGKDEEDFAHCTPTPMEDDDAPLGSSRPPSRQGSISDDGCDNEADPSPLKLQVTLPMKQATNTHLTLSSVKKCRTPQDFMKEVADAEHEACLAISAVAAKEKTECEWIKRQTAYNTAVAVEQMRIEAQEKQAAATRAHELLMLDRQIELARLHAGHPLPSSIDPRLQG
ncbi:hypothetical protein BU15DRAFT_76423 [Melanogaster broomeanus]|nr:hypothetical protein BU15DRAFT_76423 [Melanogaster broomeanus]